MLQKIRLFLKYTLSWIVIIGCIGLIGFILYPLLAAKYNSMALRRPQPSMGGFTVKKWYPLEIERQTQITSGEVNIQVPTGEKTQLDTIADGATQTVGTKTTNFFTIFKEVLSNNQPKKEVIYKRDETTGTYRST